MPTGTVKWFNNAKGYGFILSEESGEDIFAHYTAIDMEGYKTLKAGQVVNFELINGAKGVHAAHIQAQPLDNDAAALNGNTSAGQDPVQPVRATDNYNY